MAGFGNNVLEATAGLGSIRNAVSTCFKARSQGEKGIQIKIMLFYFSMAIQS